MKTKVINVGNIKIGGDNPIAVQTMWKDKLEFASLDQVKKKIDTFASMGCDLLRFAAPDLEAAEALGELSKMTDMPLAADIHFDYKIALRCMDFPIAKLRINPGNIGTKEKTAKVLEKAASKGIPIRIGVNAGSLPADLREKVSKGNLRPALALAEAAEREISIFNEFNFDNYLVSMKASGIADNIEASKILSKKTDAPLHLGVTEAGPLVTGAVSSAAALISLLKEGIGDTVRVSLSDTMENEIIAAKQIIRAAKELADLEGNDSFRLNVKGVKIVSCPRCGRHGFDTHGFTAKWMPVLSAQDLDITVAIMGCEVNGPEEAKHADLGITGAGDKVLIFKHGRIVRTVSVDEADDIFREELKKL